MSEWTSSPAVKFENIGDAVAGTITDARIVDGTDVNDRPEKQAIIDIQPDDGDEVRLYVKRGSMKYELGVALKAAGRDMPHAGDRIAVRFERTEPASKPGYSPRKVYSVAYKAGEQQAAPTGQVASAASLI